MKPLALLIPLLAGCVHPGTSSPDNAYRFRITAYDRDGQILGYVDWGESLRDGKVVVTDQLTDYRLVLDPNFGLNFVESGAARARAIKTAATQPRQRLPPQMTNYSWGCERDLEMN